MDIERILVRSPNWVGDSVLAIPAMKALRARFPAAEITLMARPSVAGLFSSARFADRVWSEPQAAGAGAWSRAARKIRSSRFDLAVLFPNSFESALSVFLGGVRRRVGYSTDGRSWLLTTAIRPSRADRHQIDYYLDLVNALSASADRPSIEIEASEGEKAAARSLLANAGVPAGASFMALNPGAAYGSAKRWGEDRFAEAARALALELNLWIAIIGSEAERPIAERIRARVGSNAVVLNGKTDLETLIGLLSLASLMITNDSGPMHIAAALGTPTVAVFGSTDERVTGPFGPRVRVVKRAVECSPCLLRQCPIDHRCMEGVSAAEVTRAAMELLQRA